MPTPTTPTRQSRWQIPAVLAVTVFINYLDRNNLSLALPRLAHDFNWSDREVGSKGELLLAAFFLSYALSNMLLSPLAERFGAKQSVLATIGAFSLVTILNAPFGYSFTALIVLRLLLGLGEGVHIPMLSAITSRWFLPGERSRANAIWGSGILLSTAIAPLIVVPLIQFWGWRPTLPFWASVECCSRSHWFTFWYRMSRRSQVGNPLSLSPLTMNGRKSLWSAIVEIIGSGLLLPEVV